MEILRRATDSVARDYLGQQHPELAVMNAQSLLETATRWRPMIAACRNIEAKSLATGNVEGLKGS
jgi:hypothetical protein